MICVLSYTETNGFTYFIDSNIFIEDESIEMVYLKLLKIYKENREKHNKKNLDSDITIKIFDNDMNLSNINEDMKLETLEDFLNNNKRKI